MTETKTDTKQDVKKPKPEKKPTKRAAEVQAQRRRRRDVGGVNLKLSIPEDKKDRNFEYRFINDSGNRMLDKTKYDDWEPVTSEEFADDRNSGEGTVVARNVGMDSSGNPIRAVLCRKRKDLCNEDRAKAQSLIDETELAIKRGPLPSQEGLGDKGKVYVPESGINFS